VFIGWMLYYIGIMAKIVNRPLKPREIKFIKAKSEGMNNSQAGMLATGLTNPESARVEAHRMLRNATVQELLAAEMEKQGLTLACVIRPVAEAMDANREVYDGDGNLVSEKPDHSIRLKAAGMAHKLMGLTNETGTTNIHFNNFSGEQQNNYQL
jgi:hypothetical protein